PLKNRYGPDIPKRIADMIAAAYPRFDAKAFLRDALDGYEALELMPRGWHMARALRRHLPDNFEQAVDVLLASLGPKSDGSQTTGLGPFLYMPHVFFVAEFGLDHFEASMTAQYELTQRFTAEFSIRPFLERHPEKTLARLDEWTRDPSPHVRRLVSEGTRPRLPWAPRLRAFQKDPRPVLLLLETLKDDPELYVRRSVANNLNDIGKDHPDVLADVARRWLRDASPERQWLIRHALRSAVKRGEQGALAALGYGTKATASIRRVAISPARPRNGGSVTIAFDVANNGPAAQRLMVDLRIHFVKASGRTSPKVFKMKAVTLAPKKSTRLSKKISLKEMTTRRHFPGRHVVETLLNGRSVPIGSFTLPS
ncbi:MAG TPA: DNA alkylation repair protein, partial [Kiritimatiellia bacterium]